MRGSHSRLGISTIAFSYFLIWIGVDMAFAQVADQDPDSDTQLVVMISGKLGSEQTFGAGIIFGREKNRLYIATANHVVRKSQEEARDLQVRLKSLPQKLLKANLLKQSDSKLDLAVLSVEGTTTDGIDLCALRMDRVSLTSVKRGDAVYPVGNPNGVPWVMPAVPDRVAQVVGDHVMVQSTVISVGHSGGGLLDESANVIGMITADQPPFGRVVKMDAILKTVQRWGYPVQLRVQLAKGWMPLHKAAHDGDATAVKNLLADTCRVDVNVRTEHGSAPLHYATKHVDIIPVLLSAGADLHATDKDGDTPLNWAAESGQLKSAELLIRAGAKIDSQNKRNMTALGWAVHNGHTAIVRSLVLAGADVNLVSNASVLTKENRILSYDTVLIMAVEKGDREIVEILLKAGAKVNVADDNSKNALQIAVEENKVELAKLLVAAGADVNARIKHRGYSATPLHSTAEYGRLEILELLLKAGAKVDTPDQYEQSPLHAVASSRSVDGVKLLLAAGADVNARDQGDATPLHTAVKHSTTEVVKALVAAGANVNARTEGDYYPTPLLLAIVKQKTNETAKVLIAAGANLNERTSDGYTPLYLAVRHKDAELVIALLKAGADVNWVDRSNYHHALLLDSETPEITKALLEAGADVNSGEGRVMGQPYTMR